MTDDAADHRPGHAEPADDRAERSWLVRIVGESGTSATADWAWVDEWRREAEPTPWGPGLGLAGFAALIIGSAVYVISAGLADKPILAILANVVVAAGLTPALWMSRQLPVLRWISLGGAVGTPIAWISILFFPSFLTLRPPIGFSSVLTIR